MRLYVFPGLDTRIVLAKSVQTILGPPYSSCNETSGYKQANCLDECVDNAITEMAVEMRGCCSDWTEECQSAYVCNLPAIDLQCNKQFPVECNQSSFPFNRIDDEWDLEEVEFLMILKIHYQHI